MTLKLTCCESPVDGVEHDARGQRHGAVDRRPGDRCCLSSFCSKSCDQRDLNDIREGWGLPASPATSTRWTTHVALLLFLSFSAYFCEENGILGRNFPSKNLETSFVYFSENPSARVATSKFKAGKTRNLGVNYLSESTHVNDAHSYTPLHGTGLSRYIGVHHEVATVARQWLILSHFDSDLNSVTIIEIILDVKIIKYCDKKVTLTLICTKSMEVSYYYYESGEDNDFLCLFDWSRPMLDWAVEVDNEFPLSDAEEVTGSHLDSFMEASNSKKPRKQAESGDQDISVAEESENLERFGDKIRQDVNNSEADIESNASPAEEGSASSDLRATPQKGKKRKRTKKNKTKDKGNDGNPQEEKSGRGRGRGRGRGARSTRGSRGAGTSTRSQVRENNEEDIARRALLDEGAQALLRTVNSVVGEEANFSYSLTNSGVARFRTPTQVPRSQSPDMSNPRMPRPGANPRPPSASGAPPRHGMQNQNLGQRLIALAAQPVVDAAAADGGRGREEHRRALASQNKEDRPQQPRLVPELTFEVTHLDDGPLYDDYKEAADLLCKARMAFDKTKPQAQRLKFNSKRIRSGDWLVWAEDEDTLEWLKRFFSDRSFSTHFKATLMSERGETVKYKVKVLAPDSARPFDELLSHLFDELGCFGYVRFTNETKWYKDPTVNERYMTAVKKKKSSQFKDGGAEFDKFIWIKMSLDAHEFLEANLHRLNYHFGVTKMSIERPPDRGDKRDNQGQVVQADQVATGVNQSPLGQRQDRGPGDQEQGERGQDPPVGVPPGNDGQNEQEREADEIMDAEDNEGANMQGDHRPRDNVGRE